MKTLIMTRFAFAFAAALAGPFAAIAVDTVDNFRRINDPRVKAFLRGLYKGE